MWLNFDVYGGGVMLDVGYGREFFLRAFANVIGERAIGLLIVDDVFDGV